MDWNKLILGKLTRNEIMLHVKDVEWQKVRVSMLGRSLEVKYIILQQWLETNNFSHSARVQVTNYVNALKRGGLVK